MIPFASKEDSGPFSNSLQHGNSGAEINNNGFYRQSMNDIYIKTICGLQYIYYKSHMRETCLRSTMIVRATNPAKANNHCKGYTKLLSEGHAKLQNERTGIPLSQTISYILFINIMLILHYINYFMKFTCHHC